MLLVLLFRQGHLFAIQEITRAWCKGNTLDFRSSIGRHPSDAGSNPVARSNESGGDYGAQASGYYAED